MISAVAELYKLHPQTLRLYERVGLLKPSRSQGNTRLYTDGDLERLDVILTLARGLLELGITHPLHVHGCNLGIPGNVETTLATIRATDGLPLHLTHIQFHSYATEGERHFSSGAAAIADLLKKYPHISIDVGQVMFGQTCTASGDSMRQYNGAKNADPKRWVVMDIECDAGCGVVPFRYRDSSYVHSLQ